MKIIEYIQDYLQYCQYRKELDLKTIKAYRIDLKQFQEFIGEKYLERQYLENYITKLHKNFKQKTVKRKIASIRAFYSYLEEKELIVEENPFHKIRVKFKEEKILPRIIPRIEIERLLNFMYLLKKRNKSILRDIAVVEFLFATGARVYEISNMESDAVDLDSGLIRIMGKGKRERYIQICNREVLNALRKYYENNKAEIEEAGYFFINSRGRRMSEQSIRLKIKKYTKAAGITLHITPHMFRHSVATYLIEEGVDISYVQRILGHSSIKTTQIYIYITTKAQTEVLRTLHPRNKMNIALTV